MGLVRLARVQCICTDVVIEVVDSAKMHTALYRANALFTMASTTLGALCVLATLTDMVRPTSPQVSRPVVVIEGLQVTSFCCDICVFNRHAAAIAD